MDEKLERDLYRENLSIAPTSKRIKAYVIDEVLISLIVFAAFWDKLANEEDFLVVMETINSLFFVIIGLKIAYQTLFVHLYGATIGKIVTRTLVVAYDDFSKPTLMAAFMRATVRIFSEMFFYFGFAWAFFNDEKQTWHDKSARTLVIDA
jgi:uncharacterized RDD family membrane protein YckC